MSRNERLAGGGDRLPASKTAL